MSFLTDLFEGNFSNLGRDITEAPSSLARHPAEIAELGGAALLGGGLLLAPEIAGALGGAEAAGAGAEAAGAGLGLETAADVGALAGEEAALGGAELGGLAELGAAAGGGELATLAPSFTGDILSLSAADPLIAGSAGSDLMLGTEAGDVLAGGAEAAPEATAATEGAAVAPPAGIPPGPAVSATTTPTGVAPVSGGTVASTPAAATTGGGLTGALSSVMASPWTKLGLGLAPLALTLARGEPGIPPQAGQAVAGASQLQAFGQDQLSKALAGQLNAGQLASLNAMKQDLTNQWKQTLFNMGVQDPSKDTRWPQIQSLIDQEVTKQTAAFIQQMIQNGLAASGQASGTLMQAAQLQMQQDRDFTNNLIGAAKALGTTVGGGTTINLKAA